MVHRFNERLVDWGLGRIAAAAKFMQNLFIMKRYTFPLLIAVAALVALSFSHPTAFHYYASIKGSKQGLLKSAANSPGGGESQGWIEIYSFSIGASNPASTQGNGGGGSTAGKVTLPPLTINKKTDGFSPLLNNLLTSSEIIDSIIIQAVDDQKRVAKTTVVRNARIKEIKKNGNNEIISFLYEHIEEK